MTGVKLLEPVTWLEGKWKGQGKGGFPTMDPFEYESQMIFRFISDAFEKEPLIQFEEIAWEHSPRGLEFKHWETGFFKPSNDRIQFYVSHNTGRIEVTFGTFLEIDKSNEFFELRLESEFLRNDEGLATAFKSYRTLTLQNSSLTYELEMSTEQVPERTSHLAAILKKVN